MTVVPEPECTSEHTIFVITEKGQKQLKYKDGHTLHHLRDQLGKDHGITTQNKHFRFGSGSPDDPFRIVEDSQYVWEFAEGTSRLRFDSGSATLPPKNETAQNQPSKNEVSRQQVRNAVKNIRAKDNANIRIGNRHAGEAMGQKDGQAPNVDNEAGDIDVEGAVAVVVGEDHGFPGHSYDNGFDPLGPDKGGPRAPAGTKG